MSATGCYLAGVHPDLAFSLAKWNTTAFCMLQWTHGHGQAADSQGSRCGGEDECKTVALWSCVELRKMAMACWQVVGYTLSLVLRISLCCQVGLGRCWLVGEEVTLHMR